MSLLPVNAGLFERTVEPGFQRISELDIDALRRMRDPWAASLAHLPFLAWGRGVDLWFEDWPEYRKRRITSQIYQMKGLKGTLPGLSSYLDFVDARIEEAILPPCGVVARPYGAERLQRFLERFAEIRLYPFAQRSSRLLSVALPSGRSRLAMVARPNQAGQFYGRRAVLVDDGVATDLRSIDQIRIDGDGIAVPVTSFAISARLRTGDPVVGRAIPGRACSRRPRARLITIGGTRLAGAVIPTGFEGVETLNASPERVVARHQGLAWQPVAQAGHGQVPGRLIARINQAERHIFDRWRLFDADRAGGDTARTLGPVVGKMVPDLKPFHALLRINAQFLPRGRPAIPGRCVAGRLVAKPTSEIVQRVGAAVYRAKALRDTVKFTTRTYRPRAIADLSFASPVAFGGMVPINRSTI
tara:strand:- start:25009 stop:26253 length:1245 start_codon:yes stop_codon:yes gene_type:complete